MVLVVKNMPANAGDIRDVGSSTRWGRSPGEGHGNPFQYSCLKSLMDRGSWRATVHRVPKNQTQLKRMSTNACLGRNPRKALGSFGKGNQRGKREE